MASVKAGSATRSRKPNYRQRGKPQSRPSTAKTENGRACDSARPLDEMKPKSNPIRVRALCREFGVTPIVGFSTVRDRMRKGTSFIEAATTPPRPMRPQGTAPGALCHKHGIEPVVSKNRVRGRMKSGMSFAEAVTKPPLAGVFVGLKAAVVSLRRERALAAELHRQLNVRGELDNVSHRELMNALRVMGALPPTRKFQLKSQAQNHGIKYGTLVSRLNKGKMDLQAALTMPWHGGRITPATRAARAAALNPQTVHSRIKRSGMTLEEALTTPIQSHNGELADGARARGLDPQTVRKRIRKHGWSLEKALTTASRPRGKKFFSPEQLQQIKKSGVLKSTIMFRMTDQRRMSFEQALAVPVRKYGHGIIAAAQAAGVHRQTIRKRLNRGLSLEEAQAVK